MLISKFNLYETGWLDLVFEDRNKAYGAYDLRKHYGGNMVKAMGITFSGVALLFAAYFLLRTAPHFVHMTEVVNDPNIIHVVQPPPPIKTVPPAPVHHIKPDLPSKPVATIKDPVMVVTPDKDAQNPVKNIDLADKAIGPTTTTGKAGAEVELPADGGGGQGVAPAPDNNVYNTGGVDVMPTPVGGDAAWAKFLNKNLRFPPAAQEDGVSGRVYMSFVIEKDGSLSNISVEKGAGHGFDEEAARVLKLAKAWKPGMQNGQPVRVRYVIPINFQLSQEN